MLFVTSALSTAPACRVLRAGALPDFKVEGILALPAGIPHGGNGFIGIDDRPFFFIDGAIIAVQTHVVVVMLNDDQVSVAIHPPGKGNPAFGNCPYFRATCRSQHYSTPALFFIAGGAVAVDDFTLYRPREFAAQAGKGLVGGELGFDRGCFGRGFWLWRFFAGAGFFGVGFRFCLGNSFGRCLFCSGAFGSLLCFKC